MRPQRLSNVWIKNPVFFITTNVSGRQSLLDTEVVFEILLDEWRSALSRHSWAVGRFVVMPDHVHFFCSTVDSERSLSAFVGSWKEWTSKRIRRETKLEEFRWQSGFFDHVLRSEDSRSLKWEYVRANPVRAGLVDDPSKWIYQGVVDFE